MRLRFVSLLLALAVTMVGFVARAQTAPAGSPPDAGTMAPDAGTTTPPAGQPAAPTYAPAPAPAPQPQVIILREPAAAPAAPQPPQEEGDRHFFLGREGGAGWVNLRQLSDNNLIPNNVVQTQSSGLFVGLRGGAKFLKILGGALEAKLGRFLGSFDTVVLLLQGQVQIPLGPVEIYAHLGVGYAYAGNFSGCADPAACRIELTGFSLNAGAGLDIRLSRLFSLGAAGAAETLNVGRSGIDSPTTVELQRPGDAVGLQLSLVGRAMLHF